MGEKIFVQGNEAIGWGALGADCDAFFGYPITPQNETTEWFAREMPKRGKVFLQSQAETGSIMMLYGSAATGARVMTSTSGPGWGLMQEGMSWLSWAELPAVIVDVQRAGGGVRHAQMDYLSVTRGGGHGGLKNIVVAPFSVQENHDHVQLAFYLADKYRNPVVVLTDGLIGQMAETLEVKTLEFGPLPEKDWALRGVDYQKDGISRLVIAGGLMPTPPHPPYVSFVEFMDHLNKKYQQIKESEIRYETYQVEDADLVIVAYGYSARVSIEAIEAARKQDIKVGLIRPITLWPFPYQVIREKAQQGCQFLVVEDSLGLMIEDVELAVQGQAPIDFLGFLARHDPQDGGMILPDRVLAEIQKLMQEGK